MKLLFLKQDALDTLKGNVNANVSKYQELINGFIIHTTMVKIHFWSLS